MEEVHGGGIGQSSRRACRSRMESGRSQNSEEWETCRAVLSVVVMA